MAGVGKRIFSLDGETRSALRKSAVDRQHWCGNWTEYTASLSWTSHGAHAALHARDHARNLRRLAVGTLRFRFRPRRPAGTRAHRPLPSAGIAERGHVQRQTMPAITRLRGCRRLTHGQL